jgi:SAM-dependent methyltransferase
MVHDSFEDLTPVYESLVDWPKRLAREAPFYRSLFAEHNVRRMADVACGTGHHAAMFYQWGLAVEGSDQSPAMISRARAAFGTPEGLRWHVRSFDDAIPADEPLDAVICVGNSLALATDPPAAQLALHQMLSAVRPGGIVVVHLLNLWSLPDGPCVWQKCIAVERLGHQAIVTKGVHRSGNEGFVDLVISSVAPPGLMTTQSVRLLGLTSQQLESWAVEHGAKLLHLLGDYQRAGYDAESSSDLIMVFAKGPAED